MIRHWACALVFGMGCIAGAPRSVAETCTTQSQMKDADRDSLAAAARSLATKVQANDAAGLRSETVPEYAKDFSAIASIVGNTSTQLRSASAIVDGVYLLEGADLKPVTGATTADAQFFCSLNRSQAEVDLLIPGLTPGRYGFAIVEMRGGASPWRLSFLLRQESGRWMMVGFYPRATQAAGHDGLWYWTQARGMASRKEKWNAWLYFGQADQLLRPAGFVQSTHAEKLRDETSAAAPPALSDGISADVPLVVKAPDGAEFRFTGLGVDDSLGKDKLDVSVHLKADALPDAAAARKRNQDAMTALVAAYPELRKAFHGVWVFAEVPGATPFGTESSMSDIR